MQITFYNQGEFLENVVSKERRYRHPFLLKWRAQYKYAGYFDGVKSTSEITKEHFAILKNIALAFSSTDSLWAWINP